MRRRLAPTHEGDNVRPMRCVLAISMCLFFGVTGCVERRLKLESDPPGALVFLNGEEVARTPAVVPLEWYGKYDVAVRKEGYETLKDERWVVAPPWLWAPLDLVAEALPVRVMHSPTMRFTLRPAEDAQAGLLERAQELREATTRPLGE